MNKPKKFKNKPNERNLTSRTVEKYKRIIDEWFINKFNGAAAYRSFYPNIKKEDTATVNFSKIQALPEMKEYTALKHQEASKIVEATHKGILKELQNWIQSDITETISLSADEIKELPIEIRRLITKYKSRFKHFYDKDGHLLNTEETIELHFVSKERAIEMVNKHIGFYEADNRQKAPLINYDSVSEKSLLEIWNARKQD